MSLKKLIPAFVVFYSIIGIHQAGAQCRSYTKRKCLPRLAPYMNNGQLNTALMSPGQTAEILMNFNSGQSYRIVVCGEGVLGPIEFQVKDATGSVLFNNKTKDAISDFWDFKMDQTSQLTLFVKVPEQVDKTQFNTVGCVTVLVGFRK